MEILPEKVAENSDGTTSVLVSLSTGDQIGFDTQRVWATGGQAFVGPESGLIVFRELAAMQNDNGDNTFLIRNVASIVMPTSAIVELHKVLGEAIKKNNPNG